METSRPSTIDVRRLTVADDRWRIDRLTGSWGSTQVARLGRVVDAAGLDGLVAEAAGVRIGMLTWAWWGDEVEVVTLQADPGGIGAGRAMMDAVRQQAVTNGARRLWLITTNDNVRALRFYQRWGMDLVALHRNGVTRARALKPQIPAVGCDDIPMRHELEMELLLG